MPSLLWLGRDFRFLDNPALRAAAAEGPVLPVFTIDESVAALGAAPRWRLEQALIAFDAAWRARTGQGLTVLRGEAADLLPPLAKEIGARTIHVNVWPWPEARPAQLRLLEALRPQGIALQRHCAHFLISPKRMQSEKGSAYKVYTPFARALRRFGPDQPLPAPSHLTALPSRRLLEAALPLAPDMQSGAAVLAQFALPAGEEAALARLDAFFEGARDYAGGRDRPDLHVCSGLSEPLALGEVSARLVWQRAALRMEMEPGLSSGLEKFLSEIIWREFAWHLYLEFPALAQQEWKPEWRGFPWRGESPDVEAWFQARTGVPLVDAGLREMRVTGRMHNRVRMVVASWLTKHLLADWRIGEAFFADSLTDWDPASNAMNWQWVAGCGPDASPFFRIFNPVKQAEQFDPKGLYRQLWLSPCQPEAGAYFAAIPKAWAVPREHEEAAGEVRLKEGRERALRALAEHRAAAGL